LQPSGAPSVIPFNEGVVVVRFLYRADFARGLSEIPESFDTISGLLFFSVIGIGKGRSFGAI
jgi:hypothetical protein